MHSPGHVTWKSDVVEDLDYTRPARDPGYLLHKNPAVLHMEDRSFGRAYVFIPRPLHTCTAALLVEIDPVGLVRGRGQAGEGKSLTSKSRDLHAWANSPTVQKGPEFWSVKSFVPKDNCRGLLVVKN